jgi:UDP-2-acetamido-3-amino-2,3-dideoxy-glucuronate N-acetyltransferase
MSYDIHPSAVCESSNIGAGTSISAYSRISKGSVIGNNCIVEAHVFIGNAVTIGNRVTIQDGAVLCEGIRIQDEVFIGANATFTNTQDQSYSGELPDAFQTIICQKASVGANATIMPGITIGQNAKVCPGAVVTHSVPPHAVVVGNPAQIIGYVDSKTASFEDIPARSSEDLPTRINQTGVKGVTLHRLPTFKDMRGSLSVGEFEREIPFIPRRYFIVFDVPNSRVRGEHAHRSCHQFIVCIKGSFVFVADDGRNREEFLLGGPSVGIYIPPLVWGVQYKHSLDSVNMVFASDYYDPGDYIRDYDEFLTLSKEKA